MISSLSELRGAGVAPKVFVDAPRCSQNILINKIAERIVPKTNIRTAISILDTGINYNHILLNGIASSKGSVSWSEDWGNYTKQSRFQDNYHGTLQAGLAAFGNLALIIGKKDEINVPYSIESGRILSLPSKNNDPELWGSVTTGTAYKLEIEEPNLSRVYSLSINCDRKGKTPSSWSAAMDNFCYGDAGSGSIKRLLVVSSGNNEDRRPNVTPWKHAKEAQIKDPAQAWNAITVGAYTGITANLDSTMDGYSPFSSPGAISAHSSSSVKWIYDNSVPIKPEIVEEGGNFLLSPCRTELKDDENLSLLTIAGYANDQFEISNGTSAACALASRKLAILRDYYHELWPESIRGLLIHSSRWTNEMFQYIKKTNDKSLRALSQTDKKEFLRIVGYGVPDIDRARYSLSNNLTMIAEGEIKPFKEDGTFNEMNLHRIPWPEECLRHLIGSDKNLSLKVTLSYFIEPNPSQRGFRGKYSYQSYGLRFEVSSPGQSNDNFIKSVNRNEMPEGESKEGSSSGWFFGKRLRTLGSVHTDTWEGSAEDLLDMSWIAIYPVTGWWKYKKIDRRQNKVRYSLIVSIVAPENTVDLYSEVQSVIEPEVPISV